MTEPGRGDQSIRQHWVCVRHRRAEGGARTDPNASQQAHPKSFDPHPSIHRPSSPRRISASLWKRGLRFARGRHNRTGSPCMAPLATHISPKPRKPQNTQDRHTPSNCYPGTAPPLSHFAPEPPTSTLKAKRDPAAAGRSIAAKGFASDNGMTVDGCSPQDSAPARGR